MMKKIVSKFQIEGKIKSIIGLNNGLVNKSYLVTTTSKKYLFQKINYYVFNNPVEVMENIEHVTNHLKDKNQRTLIIIKTKDNKTYYSKNNNYYRMYEYMDDLINVDNINNDICTQVGKAIGNFQQLLFDFNPLLLHETISKFHCLKSRINQLIESYESLNNDNIRKKEVKELYQYIIKESKINLNIDKLVDEGIIPYRIVHNDTKLNNIMFNKEGTAVTMIDLDTVMPGVVLYDYADAVRSSVPTNDENETNLELVRFDEYRFINLTIGYLSKMYNYLTYDEINQLVNAVGVITLECSCRFLTDYLNYDKYFKITYPKHNLDRAFNQITLYNDYKTKSHKWKMMVKKIYQRLIINK